MIIIIITILNKFYYNVKWEGVGRTPGPNELNQVATFMVATGKLSVQVSARTQSMFIFFVVFLSCSRIMPG
jgi:hypothetical protein